MIYDFENIFNHYIATLSAVPTWFKIAFIVVHAVVLIIWLVNAGNITSTVNSFLWLIIILKLPVIGILMYMLLSFPFRNVIQSYYNKFMFPLKWYQWLLILIAGIAAKIVAVQVDEHYECFVAFATLLLVTMFDIYGTFEKRKVGVEITPKGDVKNTYPDTVQHLLGKPHSVLKITDMSFMIKCARYVADRFFGDMGTNRTISYTSDNYHGEVSDGNNEADYRLLAMNEILKFDVSEVYSCPFGNLTGMRYLEETDGYTDKFVFVLTPKKRYVFIRFIIMFCTVVLLFTPVLNDIGITILKFIELLF